MNPKVTSKIQWGPEEHGHLVATGSGEPVNPSAGPGPAGPFAEFPEAAVEQSIPDRFEQQVRRCPRQIALRTGHHELTYDALNETANRLARAILARRGPAEEP